MRAWLRTGSCVPILGLAISEQSQSLRRPRVPRGDTAAESPDAVHLPPGARPDHRILLLTCCDSLPLPSRVRLSSTRVGFWLSKAALPKL